MATAERKLAPVEQIEQDICDLIREVGELKFKQSATEKESRKATEKLLLDIIEVIDAFDRLFENISPKEAEADKQARIWVNNFRSVRKLLERKLEAHGVARIEVPDNKARPGYHTVVDTQTNLNLDDETIVQEKKRGYLWKGEVLRKAEVITIRNS